MLGLMMIGLVFLLLWGLIQDAKVREEEEYREAMLNKEFSDNRSINLHNHYPEEGTIKNVIDVKEEK